MAWGGGKFRGHNKRLPGAFFNLISGGSSNAGSGNAGGGNSGGGGGVPDITDTLRRLAEEAEAAQRAADGNAGEVLVARMTAAAYDARINAIIGSA